ncbi:mevalonate kinase [Candidatus Woesebacteria bacterium]|nr:mevalonate kinase [Candidatus Woesebacteria bacterium]
MKITYAAPAKIILSGEHSVVYTKPAFVCAVDFHLHATVEDGTKAVYSEQIEKGIEYTNSVVLAYLKKENISANIRDFKCTIASHIPEGRGMGSSAAFCVALSGALMHFYTDRQWDKQIVNSLAYQAEKHFHGMPSGVDVSASCYGGLIFYRKEFEFLKTVSALNFKIPKSFEERLLLIDTGKPVESTKEMVSIVGKRYNADSELIERILSAIEKITKRMVISVVKEDFKMFTESIAANQKLLTDLGIVSEATIQLLEELSPFGCGKVTGAGGVSSGSGFVLFVIQNESVMEKLKKQNIPYLPFHQDLKGLENIVHV